MIIVTILLFISCILFLIGYRKERSLRFLAEHVAVTAKMQYDELQKELKPKAMTAPIVKSAAHPPKPIPPELNLPKIPRGYKRHDGGKQPVRDRVRVIVINRNGSIDRETRASVWDWDHIGDGEDIIAYKVVKPKTMKRKKK